MDLWTGQRTDPGSIWALHSAAQQPFCRTKSEIPPRTNPLVAMAEVERPVMVVTTVAMPTITQARAARQKRRFPVSGCPQTPSALRQRTALIGSVSISGMFAGLHMWTALHVRTRRVVHIWSDGDQADEPLVPLVLKLGPCKARPLSVPEGDARNELNRNSSNSPIPAWPTIQVIRMNSITPQMFNMQRTCREKHRLERC